MLNHFLSSLAYRAKWAKFGVYYWDSLKLDTVRIGKHWWVNLSFPEPERPIHEWEFGKIVFEDCYRLRNINHSVRTVLDIGANIGLFALAARHHFGSALIQCYEPNSALESYLAAHCSAVNARHRIEAIGSESGAVDLHRDQADSLHSTTKLNANGAIRQRAFSEAVNELGEVDLVKLDCEGAEWDIFKDPNPWRHIRSLVMEYHLWAKPNSTIETVKWSLRDLGFTEIQIEPSNNGPWGFAFARKRY